MNTQMQGRTVVVTGAASGIGAEVSRKLSALGARVLALDLVEPPDAEAFVEVDLADPESIERAVTAIDGPIDGLCNVAGVSGQAGADVTLRVNFLGLRKLSEGLAPSIQHGGSIVNVASFAGARWAERADAHVALARTGSFAEGLSWLEDNPVADDVAYPYSKEVLRVWSRIFMTQQLAAGVRVNVVSPGPVETPILTQFRTTLGDDRVDDDIARVGRSGRPDEVADAVVWLCTDAARWVNGVNLTADGGLAATFAPGATKESH